MSPSDMDRLVSLAEAVPHPGPWTITPLRYIVAGDLVGVADSMEGADPATLPYLAAISPDVVLALVARLKALESFARCHVTHREACSWWDAPGYARGEGCDCGAVDRAIGAP